MVKLLGEQSSPTKIAHEWILAEKFKQRIDKQFKGLNDGTTVVMRTMTISHLAQVFPEEFEAYREHYILPVLARNKNRNGFIFRFGLEARMDSKDCKEERARCGLVLWRSWAT